MNNEDKKMEIVLAGKGIIVPKNTSPIRKPKNRLFIYESGCDYLVTIPDIFDLIYPSLISDTIQVFIYRDSYLGEKLHSLLINNASHEELIKFIYDLPIELNTVIKIINISRGQAKIEGVKQSKKDFKKFLDIE
jgi:hypothetical protein